MKFFGTMEMQQQVLMIPKMSNEVSELSFFQFIVNVREENEKQQLNNTDAIPGMNNLWSQRYVTKPGWSGESFQHTEKDLIES